MNRDEWHLARRVEAALRRAGALTDAAIASELRAPIKEVRKVVAVLTVQGRVERCEDYVVPRVQPQELP